MYQTRLHIVDATIRQCLQPSSACCMSGPLWLCCGLWIVRICGLADPVADPRADTVRRRNSKWCHPFFPVVAVDDDECTARNLQYHNPTPFPPTTPFPPRSHHRCRPTSSACRDARRRRALVPHGVRGSLPCKPTVRSFQWSLSRLRHAVLCMDLWSPRPPPLLFRLQQPTQKARKGLHQRRGAASTLRSLRSWCPKLRLQSQRTQQCSPGHPSRWQLARICSGQ